MRAQFTIAAIGLTCMSAVWACSGGSSGTGTQGVNNSSSGASSSGAPTSSGTSSGSGGSSGGSTSSSGSSGSGGGSSSGATSSSGSSGSTSSSGGSSGGTSSSGTSSGGDGGVASTGDAGPLPYPAGPYCAAAGENGSLAEGCIFPPNLSWNGYVDNTADALATSKPYVSYSPLDLYNDGHALGRRYAMVNVAEFLCPGCQNSATAMGTATDGGVTEGASVDLAGGILVEVLESASFGVPTKSYLDMWAGKYMLQITTVTDLSSGLTTYMTLGHRDQAYIIDLTTMKIIKVFTGSIVNSGSANSGPSGMAYMHMLLGK